MTNEDRDKKVYELAVLVKNEDDLAGVLMLLKQHNAEITSEPRAKKLALAYVIEGHTEAVFASLQFKCYPEEAKNLEGDMNTKNTVIRFLILVAPTHVDRPMTASPSYPAERRGRPSIAPRPAPAAEAKPASKSLSNEDLGKKIEEILQ